MSAGETFQYHLFNRWGWAGFVGALSLMVVASVVGDLFESQLKRRAGMADLAGNSRAIRRVCELIAQIAPSSHSVCVQGEDGVGKTRAARAIHAASPRSAGPFITVSCASLLEEDVDAQLFGPGESATSDVGSTGGCVGRAEGGTLFLDDVADLGPIAQEILLRLARDRETRLGVASAPADVRVIVASNRDLKQEVAAGRCRRDLWEQLGALTLQIPPLRERKGDLHVLTDLFVEQFARDHGCRDDDLIQVVARRRQASLFLLDALLVCFDVLRPGPEIRLANGDLILGFLEVLLRRQSFLPEVLLTLQILARELQVCAA